MVGVAEKLVWTEVDLDNLAHNIRAVREWVSPRAKLMMVVKADGYGRGAIPVATVARQQGINSFAVGSLEEGLELRAAGIWETVLIMGPILPFQADDVVSADLTPAVYNLDLATALDGAAGRAGIKVPVHLKVDTGMGRFGVRPAELLQFYRQVAALPNVEVQGVYSHFATAGQPNHGFARKQLELFHAAVRTLQSAGHDVPFLHIANSPATVDMPEAHLDLVRVGNLIYGNDASRSGALRAQLKPTLALRARIVGLRVLQTGESVGYGRGFVARRPTAVAILPVGVAHGFMVRPIHADLGVRGFAISVAKGALRLLGGRADGSEVFLAGGRARVVGRVGMQSCAIEISHLPNVQVGDVATLQVLSTVVSSRIPRFYKFEGTWLESQAWREAAATGLGNPPGAAAPEHSA